MVALDTFHNNLCLWRCIAVLRGALPHRRTQAAIELAKSSYNLAKNSSAQRPCFNITAVIGTAVHGAFQTTWTSLPATEVNYLATVNRTTKLRKLGFCVIERWQSEVKKTWEPFPKEQTRTYPHTILYDFESYHYKTRKTRSPPHSRMKRPTC